MEDTQDLAYARWRRAPEPFWAEAAEAVYWYRRWNRVFDASRAPFYRWFSGGVVNTCYNALDRHVAAGRADQHDSGIREELRRVRCDVREVPVKLG